MSRVLVTGGAGFIGSHVVDRLVERGEEVVVMDVLDPQVHTSGEPSNLAAHLESGAVELLRGDVRDADAVEGAMRGVDVLVHLAAAVGGGQSMYTPHYYVSTNEAGQARFMDWLARNPRRVRKWVVASSMSIYGEGAYADAGGRPAAFTGRDPAALERGDFAAYDDGGRELRWAPTPESHRLRPASVYAVSKKTQEEYALVFGPAYDLPTVALRFFNVYGSRQSLNNPYTGAGAIFLSRLLNDRAPVVYEDGAQVRDFVHVHDVADAVVRAALDSGDLTGTYNVGTGRATSIRALAETLAALLDKDIAPQVTGQFRVGDIRACIADPSRARDELGWSARVPLEEGLSELVEWSVGQVAADHTDAAVAELRRQGMLR